MKCRPGVDGFLKRDQVSAQSGFFDGYNGYESPLDGHLEADRATPSKPLPSLAGIRPGGAIFLSAASVGVQSARIVFYRRQRFGNDV